MGIFGAWFFVCVGVLRPSQQRVWGMVFLTGVFLGSFLKLIFLIVFLGGWVP